MTFMFLNSNIECQEYILAIQKSFTMGENIKLDNTVIDAPPIIEVILEDCFTNLVSFMTTTTINSKNKYYVYNPYMKDQQQKKFNVFLENNLATATKEYDNNDKDDDEFSE